MARIPGEAQLKKSPRPRDAATLILIERGGGEPRVLMGRRHTRHVFMPGKFVFPGGGVEPGDRRMAIASPLDARVSEKLLVRTGRTSPSYSHGLALAAIRETFEETGLALGVTDLGAPPAPPEGAWTRFAATGVFPSLDGLDFLARAITPPGRTRRFDARFFVADASAIAHRGEGVIHAEAELTELCWAPIEEALRLDIPNITRAVLGELAALGERADLGRSRKLFRAVRGQQVVDEI